MVVSAAPGPDDTPVAMTVGEFAQSFCGQCVCLFRIAKVCYRITLEAVRPTLHDDEFGCRIVDIGLHDLPGRIEFIVAGAWWHRNIKFGAGGRSLARFLGSPGSRIEESAVFVQVCKNQVGVVLESIEDTVPVMRVDIDVGNALQSVLLSQVFDRNTAIIEYAKTCRVLPARMVQAAIGVNARMPAPLITASTAARVVPATSDAVSKIPAYAGVSPPSRNPVPSADRFDMKSM